MVTRLDFWTPVQFRDQPASLGQKLTAYVDNYFHMTGVVAVVITTTGANKDTVKLEMYEPALWLTALKVATYVTVIIPAFAFVAKVVLRSIYPFYLCSPEIQNNSSEIEAVVNGVINRGTREDPLPPNLNPLPEVVLPNPSLAEVPASEDQQTVTRVELGQTIYISPTLLLGEVQLRDEGIELNFAEITINGQTEIIPVQKPIRGIEEYIRYPGGPYVALIKMTQDSNRRSMYMGDRHYGSPVKYVLNHAHNHLLAVNPFLTSLITPNEEGQLPIHTVNSASLLEILQLVRENGFVIDAQIIKTLFNKVAISDGVELVRTLLAIDPTAIRQEAEQESFFAQAVLEGQSEKAQLFLQAMQTQSIALTPADQWLHRAFTNDCNFTNNEWLDQPFELRYKTFQIANIYLHKEFVLKLRGFGLLRLPEIPEGPALFSYNMDAIEVEKTLQGFLGNLRTKGLLLTQQEFALRNRNQYFNKNFDIGRILGRDYIEKTAQQMGLSSLVKVPRKIAVIESEQEGGQEISFTIRGRNSFELSSPDLHIFAERITPIERKVTRAEMMKLIDLAEKIGFNDFLGDNLMMGKNQAGEEGIYFIDTEYTNFSDLPHHQGMVHLASLMSPDDAQWLEEELNRRFDLFNAQKEGRVETLRTEWQRQKPMYIAYGFAHRSKPFTFAIADLVPQAAPDVVAI